jgi:CBS domain containing-hemolysin-like protein
MNDMESIYVIRTVLFLGVLLVLSAVFSASETGITSSGRGKLLALQERHPFSKTFLAWLLADVQRALTITLISNNLVNIAASAVATSLAIMLFGSSGVWLSVVCMTFLIVLFGEILPKTVAIVRSESTLLVTIPVIRFIGFILFPFIWLMMGIVRIIGVVFGVDLKNQHTFITREEIEQMVNIGEASGVFEEVERKMIHGVIAFEETRVYEIMVPRTDMDAIPLNATVTDAVALFEKHGHSRVPVFRDSFDDIVGILYFKDMIPPLHEGRTDMPIGNIIRDALFVPDTMKIVELFNIMRGKHTHMAIVVDEYGGVAGIISLEDLLEEIVGEIQDEYDSEKPSLVKEPDGTYLVQGHVGLEDLSDMLSDVFESEDAESIGGLVLSISGDFPDMGEKVHYGHWTIEVIEVEDHRIKLLRLIRDQNEEE